MAVIEDLLNGSSQMYSNTKITTLSIDDLNVNELNNAPIINIEELAHSIKENGLQTPLTCYKRDNHEYVLINGERRYTALKSLEIDDVPVIIIPKPDSILTEQLMIMDSNSQREESQEYRSLRAKEYAEIYLALKAEGRIQTGLLKIDWIGMHMNISGRQVQRLLSDTKESDNDDVKASDVDVTEEKKEKKKPTYSRKKVIKDLDKIREYVYDAGDYIPGLGELITSAKSLGEYEEPNED